eukprot:gnl/TRDRNA2_/TRDRNA2_173271_c0_seq2.p2 gnl/TRDRNA2_/TRDRNA2_173271_c0~~gnl/TRDRNA2_/TRDRNA2_173271_c0_seq2.p2  ORF type:complete len:412 (-),score=117.38 gnl/TRDRNA2_/TRDRNA2_173271_c0_seq2:131-1366(-)
MVAKRKTAASKLAGIAKAKGKVSGKSAGQFKIRIGVGVGKDFDPVKKGTQPPGFPKELVLTNDDWGKFSVDAVTALKMKELHPDLIDIDIMPSKEITQRRCQENHINLTFWPEVGTALMSGDKKMVAEYFKVWQNPENRMAPQWDYYDWVLNKSRYMTQCKKAGIPMIPTVIYTNGFDPKQCLKDVKKQGWDKFFCKVGHYTFFGSGAIHGNTEDFFGHRAKDLEKYAKETKDSKTFLVQPYTLKPNGEVFDEVRNFFIDGHWRYSVFTHGTDGSDAGYYEEPDGPRKQACKALAERVMQEVLKTASFEGQKQTPLLNRIDIGVVPKKGADSLHKHDNDYFLNEVEMICTTWLDRYSPINVADNMAHAAVKHSLELATKLLNNKKKVPDAPQVKKVVVELSKRLGYPIKLK